MVAKLAKQGSSLRADQQWPADRVERWPLAKLTPSARNARMHSGAQVAQIAASIREWGWTIPVLVDERGTLIAGHGRVLAAQKLGLTEIPVMMAAGWSDAKTRAYMLADNKLAMNAGWDDAMLGIELADLRDAGVDLELAGFTKDEVSRSIAKNDKPDGSSELLDRDAAYKVMVDCDGSADQAALIAQLEGAGRVCKPLML